MVTSLTAVRQRVLAFLGGISMYRTVFIALAALAAIAMVMSLLGVITVASTLDMVVSLAVLAVVVSAVDFVAQRILKLPWRIESSLVTALILFFVMRPGVAVIGGLAIAAAVASLSKYLIVWRGRHILNPAAFGAAVVSLLAVFPAFAWLGTSAAWWVATPSLFVPVLVFGLIVLWRTEKVRVIGVFLVVVVAIAVIRQAIPFTANDTPVDVLALLVTTLTQFPFLFLGAFMLSEPLTLPPRRWQQFIVAGAVGVLAGWPIMIPGLLSLGQDRALLIGNLIAFAFAVRSAVRLTLDARTMATATVNELTFTAHGKVRFQPGQYLELEVPHRHPDARGTRREFSIVSAPSDLPTLRIAYKNSNQQHPSSYKRALAERDSGAKFAVTGTWGDFILPRTQHPVLMVAAGIGVTPFVSQLRELQHAGHTRDIVLIYVATDASELAFRDELAATGVRTIVFTRDEPQNLPEHWTWAEGARLDAASLDRYVDDLGARDAFISGPPRLIADLAPAMKKARSLTTDAFAGY